MTKPAISVAVTGAAGHIGYALLFRIASGQMFGADTPINLKLIEIEAAVSGLEGVAMELTDCAFPLLNNVSYTADLATGFKDVNWGILVGAAPRKAGMERADLLKINGGIFAQQGAAINQYGADDVRVFVVGNPCNTNCLIAMHHAPDVPQDRFYAMTSLDELRARSQLAMKANVPVTAINKMIVWGNHSSTQYPDFYHANINEQAVTDVIQDTTWLQNDFIATVQQRGAAVIKARGASSAASAANAVVHGIHQLTHDTPEHELYSMSRCSQGEYGIDPGLIFSVPCQTRNGQLQIIEGLIHNEFGAAKMQQTLDELRQEKHTVKQLKLLG